VKFKNEYDNMTQPDWTLWRSFCGVVEHGSLSAAARALGLSQPTLGRHVEMLETNLSARLFERQLRGLKPTEVALRLYEQVRVAQKALSEAAMMAEGTNESLSGTVRITASTVTSHYSLPPILHQLRAEFPAIAIELVPSDSAENLLMRESDIAVRMFRPQQLELITRKIGESQLICCAHEDYLAKHGPLTSKDDLLKHDLIGYDRSDLLITGAKALGFETKRQDYPVRTDSQTLIWELTKAGLGVSFAQEILVANTPGVVPLLPGLPIPPLEVWLTTHRELFTNRRIRVIYDRLSTLLTKYYAARTQAPEKNTMEN
jgi:DNA-binding transcriptional LysR family regulator